ncbi:MAG: sigma-54 dependent transcriptional regulator, partial [Proteobacteria bacterium]|nr:sigma-54 dependent transcriptional regulator [Pseudomonadota bacterium]
MTGILIIDDDQQVRQLLAEYLKGFDCTLLAAESLSEGLTMVDRGKPDLVLLDVNLPDGNGLDALSEIKQSASEPEVIIITAEGNTLGARMAIEHDAWDYLLKPFSEHEIKLNVKRALEFRSSKRALKSSSASFFDRSSIIGNSPKITARLNLAAQCAQCDVNVLVTGPTGTGKELLSHTIHKNSIRRKNNFIVVDCAALPEQLVESVLFGHVKGAYTSADANREGLIKKADKGTLFLDEIGELPPYIQKKFLRVLQERRFKPVGGNSEVESDFRLVSATNRNLEEMVRSGEFRSD